MAVEARKKFGGRESWREGLASDWAKAEGWHGATGGWIYNARGESVIQGYFNLYHVFERRILDHATKQLTGFGSFQELINAPGSYRPTFLVGRGKSRLWRVEALAEAYDEAQKNRKDPRRAFRGTVAA